MPLLKAGLTGQTASGQFSPADARSDVTAQSVLQIKQSHGGDIPKSYTCTFRNIPIAIFRLTSLVPCAKVAMSRWFCGSGRGEAVIGRPNRNLKNERLPRCVERSRRLSCFHQPRNCSCETCASREG